MKTRSYPLQLLLIAVGVVAVAPDVASAVDLFKKLDIENATQSGRWERNAKDKDIVRCRVNGAATLDLADEPDGDYTYRVECMRYESEGPFGIYFFVDGKPGTFFVGGSKGQATDGFTLNDGMSTGQNALPSDKAPVVIKNMEAVKIVLTVKGGTLRAKVNGTTVAELKKGQGEIDIFDGLGIGRNKLGLVALDAGVIFRKARLVAKKLKVVKSEETPKFKKPGSAPVPEFDVGDIWKGDYMTSERYDGFTTMKITDRKRDRYHAVVELGKMGTLEFDFQYQNLHFIAENIQGRWTEGTRKIIKMEVRIPQASEVYLSFEYTLNEGRPDETSGNGHCIFLNYEPKNPKPKPAPKADSADDRPMFPKLAVGEVWKGSYYDDLHSANTCTLKITGMKDGWYQAELLIGDDQVYAFELSPDPGLTAARNVQDRSKTGERRFRSIEVVRSPKGTSVMLDFFLTTKEGRSRGVFGQADFVKK